MVASDSRSRQIPCTRLLLVPTSFLSSVHLHEMTIPFYSNRNRLLDSFSNLKTFFSNLYICRVFLFCAVVVIFKLCKLSFV